MRRRLLHPDLRADALTVMTLSPRRPFDDKLDVLLASAARIFADKGYHNASIRDLARQTGVSLSGLYHYFDSKEELLFLIQDHALAGLLEGLDERLTAADSPEERLKAFIRNQLTFFVDNMAEMKVLSHEAESLSGDYLEVLRLKKRKLASIATGLLEEVRPQSDYDPRVATFALFGMMNWLYNWYRPGRDPEPEALVDELARIFLHGFADMAPPGRTSDRPPAVVEA